MKYTKRMEFNVKFVNVQDKQEGGKCSEVGAAADERRNLLVYMLKNDR